MGGIRKDLMRPLNRIVGPIAGAAGAAYGAIASRLDEAAFAADPEREARIAGWRALQSHLRAGDLAGTLVFPASGDCGAMSGQTVVTGMGSFYCQRQR